MKTHWQHLESLIPGLVHKHILDLGSGKGGFIIDAASHGALVAGLEPYGPYREITNARAREKKINIRLESGCAEEIPFGDSEFDFVNMCEIIEHVESPVLAMEEVFRVTKEGGRVYISAPNRFGFKDQHFHLYFVNWLPRRISDHFIGIFGKHKNYEEKGNGRQRLREMHYYTFGQISALTNKIGFSVEDIRLKKIEVMIWPKRVLAQVAYVFARAVYFDSFHLLLTKKESGYGGS